MPQPIMTGRSLCCVLLFGMQTGSELVPLISSEQLPNLANGSCIKHSFKTAEQKLLDNSSTLASRLSRAVV